MNKEQFLLQKLEQISNALTHNEDTEQIGVLSGSAGVALFQFYYSKLLNEESHADRGAATIVSIIEKINAGYDFHTFCSGIAGALWAIQLLQEEDFIDLDCDELLSDLDNYLIQSITQIKEDQNFYDFLHGILGIGYFFLKRYTHTKSDTLRNRYHKILMDIILFLKEKSLHEGDITKWESYLIREEGLKGYNLGLSHGMTSIINFLSRLAVHKEFKKEVETLVHRSIKYILQFKNEDSASYWSFPSWITKDGQKSENSRLAWCYGDLGIVITLWRAGEQFNNPTYKQEAIAIAKHTTKRRDIEEAGVKDAGLCHGAYGIMHIYNHMYKETQEIEFKEAADFWMDKGIDMAIHQDGYAGYMSWKGGENAGWEKETNLLEGVAGIGLSIISYLAPFKTKWDECLLIG